MLLSGLLKPLRVILSSAAENLAEVRFPILSLHEIIPADISFQHNGVFGLLARTLQNP